MVFENHSTQMIMDKFPELANSPEWKDHLEFWGDDQPGPCTEMSVFGRYTCRILNEDPSNLKLKEIFEFIEKLMIEGDQTTQDAAATCFLENLLNYDSAGHVKAKSFTHFLGPESRAYCKAWDEFTGVKTEGLWE